MQTSPALRLTRTIVARATVLAVLAFAAPSALAENPQEAIGFTPNHVLVGDAYGEYVDHVPGSGTWLDE